MYPNPNSGNFIIEIEDVKGDVEIEVLSSLGTLAGVYTATLTESNHTINIDGLREGMYFVKIKANNVLLETKRVVVTK